MILSEAAKRVKRLSEFYNDRLPDSYPVGIHKAVLEGNLYMVAQFIVSGKNVNSRDSFYHCTVLHLAVITRNIALGHGRHRSGREMLGRQNAPLCSCCVGLSRICSETN